MAKGLGRGQPNRDSAVRHLPSGVTEPVLPPAAAVAEIQGQLTDGGGGDQRTVQGPVHPQVYYSSISHTMWPKEVPSNPSCSTRRHPVEAQVELED